MLPACTSRHLNPDLSGVRTGLSPHGSFKLKRNGVRVKRYRCQSCGKTFSENSFSEIYRQKKPHINPQVFELLCSTVSQRRSARILKVNRKTIVRKFLLMGKKAEKILPTLNSFHDKIKHFQFDDLETFEHTKFKPLSVTMIVEKNTRWIIGFRVSRMAAKGLIAKAAVKKYGVRKDTRREKRNELFEEIKTYIDPKAKIESDKNPHYWPDVKKHFPEAEYETHLSRRAAVVGQGELKKGGFDPLFSLNHTYAMLRANINRLLRKTWCTTKIPERLGFHIAMYSLYHNMLLLPPKERESIRIRIAA